MRHAVGLEIADTMLRAVTVGGKAGVRHAEVELPAGAVRHGDVVDAGLVIAALRELWRIGRFTSKRVVVGIGNSDVVTRQVDLPDVGDRDLHSALRFEMGDMIPFPVADSVLDLTRMGTVTDDRGVEQARVLAVAALKSSLKQIVTVLEAAGLVPVAIDHTPFALIRAVAAASERHFEQSSAGVDESVGGANEAIVHLGDFSISVVVHRDGIPQFTRCLATSAEGSGISAELESELELIEQYLRRSSGQDERTAAAATDPVVSAIRGTLEYYAIQPGAAPIDRITLTGHHSWAAKIAPSVATLFEVPVGLVDPLDDEAAYQPSPFIAPTGGSSFAAALGLAIRPGPGVLGPDTLALLPSKEAPTGPRALAVRAGLSLVITLAALTAITVSFGPDVDSAVGAQLEAESHMTDLSTRVEAVEPSIRSAGELANLKRLNADIAAIRIDWPRLLGAIDAALPADIDLLSVTAKAPSTDPISSAPGSIELTAQTSNQASIATLLTGLAAIPGIESPWLDGARAGSSGEASGLTSFTITLRLADGATVVQSEPALGDPDTEGSS